MEIIIKKKKIFTMNMKSKAEKLRYFDKTKVYVATTERERWK